MNQSSLVWALSKASVMDIIKIFVISTSLYIIILALYNLYFHPLSRYPGPKSWAISRLPFIRALWSGDLAHEIVNLHEKYGDTVRVAPNELSFTNPQACRDLYGARSGHPPFPKCQVWMTSPPKDGEKFSSITDANDKDHTRIRRAWAHGFSEKSLKEQEPLITHHVDLLLDKLSQQDGDVDIVKWLTYLVFDITGDLTFGESFGCVEGDRNHAWVATVLQFIKASVLIASCRYYPLLYYVIERFIPKSALEKKKQHYMMTKQKVQHRLAAKKDRSDFMQHMISSHHELTDAEIENTAAIIVVAGSSTTKDTLAGAIYYLLRFPEALELLVKEIRGTYSSKADMNLTNLSQLPYLSAVIQEALRLVAPVALGLQREVPKGGDTICGQWFQEGTGVSYAQWAANLSKANFARPREFLPERWLDSALYPSSQFAHDRRDALQPFSMGPRNCLGQRLAYFELRLILARLVLSFDISLPDGPGTGLKWTNQKTYLTWVTESFMIRLTPV